MSLVQGTRGRIQVERSEDPDPSGIQNAKCKMQNAKSEQNGFLNLNRTKSPIGNGQWSLIFCADFLQNFSNQWMVDVKDGDVLNQSQKTWIQFSEDFRIKIGDGFSFCNLINPGGSQRKSPASRGPLIFHSGEDNQSELPFILFQLPSDFFVIRLPTLL